MENEYRGSSNLWGLHLRNNITNELREFANQEQAFFLVIKYTPLTDTETQKIQVLQSGRKAISVTRQEIKDLFVEASILLIE